VTATASTRADAYGLSRRDRAGLSRLGRAGTGRGIREVMVEVGTGALRGMSVVALALALSSCSGPGSDTPATGESAAAGTGGSHGGGTDGSSAGSATVAGGGAAGTNAAGGANSGGGDGAAGSANPMKWGQVLLRRSSQSAANNGTSLSVMFRSMSGDGRTCTTTTDGACKASVCEGTAAPDATTYASAGTVTITSPDLMGSAVAIPNAENTYASPTISFPMALSGEEPLQISASGGEVPAFQGELVVPLVLLMSSPTYAKPQTSVEVPRDSDLSLVWTRGAEDVVLWVQGYSVQASQQPGAASLICQFPSDTGNGTIKSSLLQLLGPGGRLDLLTIRAKTIAVGDYSVALAAAMPTANANKEIVPQLTLK